MSSTTGNVHDNHVRTISSPPTTRDQCVANLRCADQRTRLVWIRFAEKGCAVEHEQRLALRPTSTSRSTISTFWLLSGQ